MRDFEQDILYAAHAGEPIPASEFSWSIARHNLFRFCRRAYFIRYYLAQGGWNLHAHPLCRSAYLEKYLPTLDQWIAAAFENAVRAALETASTKRNEDTRADTFRTLLLRHLQQQTGALYRSLESRAYLEDPKLPGLREHYRQEEDFFDLDRLCARIVKRVADACAVFLNSEIMRPVGALSYPDYRLNNKFLCLPWRGFSIYLHGGIIRFEADNVIMLNIAPETEGGNKRFVMGLETAIFERIVRHQWVNRVPSLEKFLIGEDSAAFLFTPESLPAADVIDVSAESMLLLVDENGMVKIDDFPECGDPEKCAACQFRNTCTGLNKEFLTPPRDASDF